MEEALQGLRADRAVVLDALQHSEKISDALKHSEKTSGAWQHSAKDVLLCVHALKHCHGKSATVSFLLSHFFAAFVFFAWLLV